MCLHVYRIVPNIPLFDIESRINYEWFVIFDWDGAGMATIKKLKSGLWQAQVFTKGVRDSCTRRTKVEAKDWAAVREHQIKAEVFGVKSVSTFGEVALRYEAEFSRKKRGVAWEQGQIRRLCDMPIANLKMSEITKQDIIGWRDSRLRTQANPTGVLGETVLREWNLLSHIFSMARDEWEIIKVNPMTGVRKPKGSIPRDRLVSPEEVEQICFVAGFDGGVVTTLRQRTCVAFLFALETAMRSGEICKMTWEMVDKEKRSVALPEWATKNGGKRGVALSTRAVELLETLPPDNPEGCFGLKSKQVQPHFSRLVDKTPIEGLTFHDTRHEAITRLAKKMPVLALARNVGHTNINQLLTYYNESAENIAKLLE